jgi:hypothetical protein
LDYLFGVLIPPVGRQSGFAAQILADVKSLLDALVFDEQGLGQVIDKTILLEGLAQNPTVPAFVTSTRILSSADDEDDAYDDL